jgi:hypothetical protein
MSDIFWITGFEIKGSNPGLRDGLESAGIHPAWIEVVHSIMDPADQRMDAPWSEFQAIYRWSRQVLLCDFLLQDACRALLTSEHNLVLLAEKEAGSVHYALLASPQAIGRYNLMPRAHIAAWWTLSPATLPALPQKLEKSGFDRDCVQWVNGEKEIVEQAQMVFPDIQAVKPEQGATIARFNGLIHKLDEKKCSHGFLLAGSNDSPLLATLVER